MDDRDRDDLDELVDQAVEAAAEKVEPHMRRIREVTDALKATTDEKEKERLTAEFWLLAVDAFNTHIAGDIRLADGRIIRQPKMEL